MLDLLTPSCFAISVNFAFSLNFSKRFPCWCANQCSFFLLLMIFSKSRITTAASSVILTLLAYLLQLFVLRSLTIDNRIFRFLLYLFLQLSCFAACFRNADKVLYLKLKNKLNSFLK